MPKRKRVEQVASALEVVRAGVTAEEGAAAVDGAAPEGTQINMVTKMLRVQQVATWLMDGLTSGEVLRRGTEKWSVHERTIKRYIAVARDQIEAAGAQELRSAATLALYRLTELYFAAVQGGDLKTALDVVKAQNRMLGLNAPEKFETKNITDWNSMSVAEQLSHVANILEKANSGRSVN